MDDRIVWRCERCGELAAVITINSSRAVTKADEARRQEREADQEHLVAVSAEELLAAGGEDEHWNVTCTACLTSAESDDDHYWIETDRIRTAAEALEWTLHLHDTKDWVLETDWAELMRQAVLMPLGVDA